MTPTIDERFDSRPCMVGDEPTIDLIYVVRGTDNDGEVRAMAKGASPVKYQKLTRDSIRCEPIGGKVWHATVHYRMKGNPSDFEFDTSGGSQRISTSLATTQRVALPNFVAPNFQGAINVTDDRVEGTDVTIPVYTFSETHYYEHEVVTPQFKLNIFSLTGQVNDKPFREFAKGEVLFLGGSGVKRGDERWAITYKFAASPNVNNQAIGSGALRVTKEGWQYLWVRFQDEVDADSLVKIPTSFYVEQVYPYGDFGRLDIDPDE